MSMTDIKPIIMAGGSGTRLWPLSRSNYPKQFLSLTGGATMLQNTITRLQGLEHSPVMLICNELHRFIAAEQLRQLNIKHGGILLEPVGRNTAPAIALAAMKATESDQDPLLLVLAADHVIDNVDCFQQSINMARELALSGKLVTFGIIGNKPETGYGYIKRGEAYKYGYVVDRFVEKPDIETAKLYISSGDYYWNSGMFLFKASRYLSELRKFRPDIYSFCKLAMQTQTVDEDFIRIDKMVFEACPDDSIDYAVMEHTEDAVVVPMDAGWSDVGGFAALWEVLPKNSEGNVLTGDVKTIATKNTLVFNDDKLVTTIGVDDLIIVSTKDALLVTRRDQAQHVKSIVDELKLENRDEVKIHRAVYRPWGKCDSIDNGEHFQLKRITVKPGERISTQIHNYRSEHWIVVSGTAKVVNGITEIILTENQSTYIPAGVVHTLENPSESDLELIEVQLGSYLGEDDIIRLGD
ncbi:mannose-1-phosphate guanylyltransferase/mannose-6-phosphate isomerase [Escherichia albertii]|uniref:mannose-1-phosphate guanylyltransferase/mannose-6-phosphate isomerase n=1 Tax=Escherichia albertii TaxID=208962 RepID=UPI0003EE0F8A|nr:mannose-1-phosphate guanylyltransferase/mannose-6-phosphate isomerase [Escherichia albertii]